MAVLTRRGAATTRDDDASKKPPATTMDGGTETPRSASPPLSDDSSRDAADGNRTTTTTTNHNKLLTVAGSKGKSLQERGQIPNSFYVTLATIFGLQYFSGLWCLATFERWYSSLKESTVTAASLIGYTRDLAQRAVSDQAHSIAVTEYARTGAIVLFCLSLSYVFVVAPAKAGFWTGPRARRHQIHRYMGLSYLLHYALAWIEFFTNYETSRTSYLVHIITLNGMYCSRMLLSLPTVKVGTTVARVSRILYFFFRFCE